MCYILGLNPATFSSVSGITHISAGERPETYGLDRRATGICTVTSSGVKFYIILIKSHWTEI